MSPQRDSMRSRALARIGARRVTIVIIALLVVLGLALSGGLKPAPDAPRRMLAIGDSIDAGEWRLRPLRAWQGARCAMDSDWTPAARTVSLEVEMTNLTRGSLNTIVQPFGLIEPALPRSNLPQLELVRDRGVLGYLQPRLPERVVLCWKVGAELPPLTRIVVALRARRFKERDNLQGGEGWFDPKEIARIEIPIGDVDAAALKTAPKT